MAPAAVELALTGQVEHPRTLTLADLQALPPTSVEVVHASNQGEQRASYTGALLWTLLGAAAAADRDGPRTRLEHTLLARGRDGYAVALAIGELDRAWRANRSWSPTPGTASQRLACSLSFQGTATRAAASATWLPSRCAEMFRSQIARMTRIKQWR